MFSSLQLSHVTCHMSVFPFLFSKITWYRYWVEAYIILCSVLLSKGKGKGRHYKVVWVEGLLSARLSRLVSRPGVARDVLQTPSLFIYSVSQSAFSSKSWAEIFTECSPPTTFNMSCVICHVSRVTCQVSHVMCCMSKFYLASKKIGQSG